MCGIFGIVSQNSFDSSNILTGLKKLEYRGYDSWGIAIKSEDLILIEKHVGKIGDAKTSLRKTVLGIGHTRWATHGGVTQENAHPHLDCTKKLALVHNGIVENYEALKSSLIKKGHLFTSQTDSEIIVHLIEENLKKENFIDAIAHAFLNLHGLNAILVLNSSDNKIIAIKNGSPLIIGFTKTNYYIASDISAFPLKVSDITVVDDNQIVVIDDKVQILDLSTRVARRFIIEKITRDHQLDSKGKYEHFLLKEINDQPLILKNIAALEKNSIKRISIDINKAFGTFTLGCGTASYAALSGEYLLSNIAKKHVNFSVGSEFNYLQDFITKKSLIIPVSQSGETVDIIEPVKNAKRKGAKIISIVNTPSSTLARLSDYCLYLHAGVEKAVVGTKSFTSMIAIFLLIAYAVSGKTSEAEILLSNAAKDVAKILSKERLLTIKNLAKKLKTFEHAFTIGRGISYIAALEGALKLKETALIHAEGFAGGELKHGVIALIEKGTPCFIFAPNDNTYPEIISNAQEIKARGGYIIGIGPMNNSVFDVFFPTKDLKEATLISQTVYMQLLAYYLALQRGVKDPDKPRNLAKSVTVK